MDKKNIYIFFFQDKSDNISVKSEPPGIGGECSAMMDKQEEVVLEEEKQSENMEKKMRNVRDEDKEEIVRTSKVLKVGIWAEGLSKNNTHVE